jgi:hypothetical protein
VANTVTLKYTASVRESSSLKAAGCAWDMSVYAAANSSRNSGMTIARVSTARSAGYGERAIPRSCQAISTDSATRPTTRRTIVPRSTDTRRGST